MSHLVIYKDIEHERLGDAPFIGALIIAAQCTGNCPGCFNQHLKDDPNQFSTAAKLIQITKSNPLNEGIILGGLEWSEQPYEMLNLVEEAIGASLEVMIYTRMTEDSFLQLFPSLRGKGVWCKFGEYDVTKETELNFSHGVKLATSNQYIKYLKYL